MRTATLLAAALLFAASCGGSADPGESVKAGEIALGAHDTATAQAEFAAALDAIGGDTSHPMYVRAKLGAIEASVGSDPTGASADLLALQKSAPDEVTDGDFNRILGKMGAAGRVNEAIALLGQAKELYPESKHLDLVGEQLVKLASKSDNPEALEALAGLGYVGD